MNMKYTCVHKCIIFFALKKSFLKLAGGVLHPPMTINKVLLKPKPPKNIQADFEKHFRRFMGRKFTFNITSTRRM